MKLEENEKWQIPFLTRRINSNFEKLFGKDEDLPTGIWYVALLHSTTAQCKLGVEIRAGCSPEKDSFRYVYAISCPLEECVVEAQRLLEAVTIDNSESELNLLVDRFNNGCEDRTFALRSYHAELKLEFADSCGRKRSISVCRSSICKFLQMTHVDLSVFFEYPFVILDSDGCPSLESCAEELITRYVDYSHYVELDELQYELSKGLIERSRFANICIGDEFRSLIDERVHNMPMRFIESQKKSLIDVLVDGNPGMPF